MRSQITFKRKNAKLVDGLKKTKLKAKNAT